MGAGPSGAIEIPLLLSFLYLFGRAEIGAQAPSLLEFKPPTVVRRGRSAPKTVSGGQFDWGGTSVKR